MSRWVLTSTAEIEKQVLLFQSVSGVCLALGGVCLLFAVFLFWRFRIARVVAFKLGITARQSIREIEESNAAAAIAPPEGNATTVLERSFAFPEETTTRLDSATAVQKTGEQPEKLQILCDIMMLHSEERIG